MSKTHFSSPGFYQIEVEGMLPKPWFYRLGEMHVLKASQKKETKVTIMQGRVADQADLSGILNSLYELHMPLLSVKFIGTEIPPADTSV